MLNIGTDQRKPCHLSNHCIRHLKCESLECWKAGEWGGGWEEEESSLLGALGTMTILACAFDQNGTMFSRQLEPKLLQLPRSCDSRSTKSEYCATHEIPRTSPYLPIQIFNSDPRELDDEQGTTRQGRATLA